MSKNIKKTIVKKVVMDNSESDNESTNVINKSDFDVNTKKKTVKITNNDDSNSESDDEPEYVDFEDLNILKKDLIQLKLNTKDCCTHYYHSKEKCIYSKFKGREWFKPNDFLQKQLHERCVELGENCGIVLDDGKKKGGMKKGAKVEKDEVKKIRNKLSKDEMYKKDQDRTFEELKNLIKVKKNNTFTSEDVKEQNNIIVTDILEKLKKYYNNSLSRGINTSETKASVAIIRKIFKHHGFELATKEYANGDTRGVKYVMVACNEDNTDEEKNDF